MSILQNPTIREFLERHANHQPGVTRVAVFDCDYTMIQGDIGEAMFYRQIRDFLFRVSPAEVWTDYPRRKELDRLYHTLASLSPEARRGSAAFDPFANILLDWYFGQLGEGEVEKGCADIVRLFAGFTRSEVQSIADATYDDEMSTLIGEFTLGSRNLPRGLRYIRESADLARALSKLGFSLWVISGSNKWSVEPVFRPFGVPREQVIGIDLAEEGGRFSAQPVQPIPIRRRKVEALRCRTEIAPLLAISDSKNDIPLLQYASEVRVYVNSHRREIDAFFASTGTPRDDSWVVIDPPTMLDGVPSHG